MAPQFGVRAKGNDAWSKAGNEFVCGSGSGSGATLEALLLTELATELELLDDTGTGACSEEETLEEAAGFGVEITGFGTTGFGAGTLLETDDEDCASRELEELLSSMTMLGWISASEELTEDSEELSSAGGVKSAARCSTSPAGFGICVNLCAWYVWTTEMNNTPMSAPQATDARKSLCFLAPDFSADQACCTLCVYLLIHILYHKIAKLAYSVFNIYHGTLPLNEQIMCSLNMAYRRAFYDLCIEDYAGAFVDSRKFRSFRSALPRWDVAFFSSMLMAEYTASNPSGRKQAEMGSPAK